MAKLVKKTIELSDGRKLSVEVPDNWSDDQISQWAMNQIGQGLKDPRAEPVGRMASLGLGAQREAGAIKSGIEELVGLAGSGELGINTRDREKIVTDERERERILSEQTREHPGFAAAGRAVPYLPFSAGRTPAGALLRGAAVGSARFEEDPMDRAVNTLLGGGANLAGYNLLRSPLNPNARESARFGMQTLPEQRGPVLIPQLARSDAFRREAFGVSEANNKVINRATLDLLGEQGDSFTHSTFANAEKRAGDLFNKARGSKENIVFDSKFRSGLDQLLATEEGRLIRRAKATKIIDRLNDKIYESGDVLKFQDYMALRKEITDEILGSGTKAKGRSMKRVLGGILEHLDNHVQGQVASSNPKLLKQFRRARQLWRDYSTLKTPGLVDFRSGNVNPVKYRSVLRRQDETGFLLNRSDPEHDRVYRMLKVDELTPEGANRFDVFGQFRDFRSGGGFLGSGAVRAIERGGLGISRLPTRAIEGAPLGLTVPNVPTLNLTPLLGEQ